MQYTELSDKKPSSNFCWGVPQQKFDEGFCVT